MNAFGDYARIVSRLASVFVPDMTIGSSDLNVEIVETSLCLTPDELPGMPSTNRREMDWTVDDPIVVRGWKTAWESEEGEEEFCAFIIVSNLCARPSTFKLSLGDEGDGWGGVSAALHEFDQDYNVAIDENGEWEEDTVGGYGTTYYRLGCSGFVADPSAET